MAAHGNGCHARCGEHEAADNRFQAGGGDAERCGNSTQDGSNRKITGVPLDRRRGQRMRYRGGEQSRTGWLQRGHGALSSNSQNSKCGTWQRRATKVAADDAARRDVQRSRWLQQWHLPLPFCTLRPPGWETRWRVPTPSVLPCQISAQHPFAIDFMKLRCVRR